MFFLLFLDAVVRTSYYKYFHPKEVYVSNGVLNRYTTKPFSCNSPLAHALNYQDIHPLSISALNILLLMNKIVWH